MSKKIVLVLLVFLFMSSYSSIVAKPHSPEKTTGIVANSFPPKENITFAIYTGGNPEITEEGYSLFKDTIKGLGFNLKKISTITADNLVGVTTLVLLSTSELSSNEIGLIENYTLLGGNVLYLLPQNVTKDVKSFLGLFGLEPLGLVKDNKSYFENKTSIELNDTWPADCPLLSALSKILFVNGTALNYTGYGKILDDLKINMTIHLVGNDTVNFFNRYAVLWGNNSTYYEYKKGHFLNGTNITLGVAYEYWSGARVLFLSSPFVFADKYISAPGYDNREFMRRVILWLGDHLGYIDINLMNYAPHDNPINLDDKPKLSLNYTVVAYNVSKIPQNISLEDVVKIYGGIRAIGSFGHIVKPNITSAINASDQITYNITMSFALYEIFNRSIVIYIQVFAVHQYSGFCWSEALRIELLKPKVSLKKFDPILFTTIIILVINIVALIVVFPTAIKARRKAREIEQKVLK